MINILQKASVGWGPLLIAIYLTSQLASTYFMSATMEKTQRMLLFAMPFVFTPFIIHFKAGLVLYWATTNLWTVGQGLITRRLVPRTKVALPRRTSRTPPRDDGRAGDGVKPKAPAPSADSPAVVSAGQPRKVKRKKKRARR